jgi:putative hydrolase of HD superfamily
MKKFSNKLENLMDFINFTHEFREIIRYEGTKLGKKVENDTEHSYQLAMVAWFLIEQDKLNLDKELCLMYALAHDLVEIYAGDTFAFNKQHNLSKQKREKEALKKIKKRFPGFKTLTKVIEKFENMKDGESKFIYALDKIMPPIQIYLENGKMWHDKNVSHKELTENKNERIPISKDINKYWQELSKELTKNKSKFFPK